MARPRLVLYRTLPPNLYFDSYSEQFRYRRPDTKTFHWVGKDRTKAASIAKQLNSMLMDGRDLVTKIAGRAITLQKYLDEHFVPKHLSKRSLSAKTTRNYNGKMVYIKNALGNKSVDEIGVRHIAEFLEEQTPTQANRYRSLLNLIFQYVVADGYAQDNPVAKTMNQRIEKQRTRLSVDGFKAIYEAVKPSRHDNGMWIKNAMDLALITLQRREDILMMKFSDIKTEIDKKTGAAIEYLYVTQNKTKKHGECAFLKIKIGCDLKKVIDRCRDKIDSPFLIHREADRTLKSKVKEDDTQVLPDFLSQTFAEIRDQLDLFKDMPMPQRPGFHEIRSLGIKRYEDAGIDAQKLAGHTTRKMTNKYKEGHEGNWTLTEANLELLVKPKNTNSIANNVLSFVPSLKPSACEG